MKIFFCIFAILLLTFSLLAFAQTNTFAKDTDSPSAAEWFEKGWIHYNNRDYNAALQAYAKSIELDPKDASAYYSRGLVYYNLEKYDAAISDYNEALEIDPKDAGHYYARAVFYSSQNNRKKAIQDLSKAISIMPDARKEAKTNPAFDNIRNTPEFKRLIGK